MRTKPLARLAVLALAGCLVAACGSSGSSGSAGAAPPSSGANATGASAPAAAGSSPEGTVSDASIRVANMYVTDSLQPGPGLDVYDVQLSGQAAKPILTNVPYGSFSAYVHPHVPPNAVTKVIELTALPTGEDPVKDMQDAKGIGGLLDDNSGAQETFLLTNDVGGARESVPLDALSESVFVEKGDDGNGGKAPVAPPAPSGQGELLASTAVLTNERINGGAYLMIDSACDEPLNHDPNSTGVPEIFAAATAGFTTSFALFPVAAGSHQVSIVWWDTALAPTCAQLTAKQGTTSVDAVAGQQALVFAYGTSATDLHLAVGPIQQ